MNLSLLVRKNYGSFRLVSDIRVSGDRVGIFGASGSGKSTLVGMLAGLVRPDQGEITLDGETLFSSADGIDLPPSRRRIAMVFQQHELFAHLNVKNNLLYGYKRCAPRHRRIDLSHLIEVLQIAPLLERGINTLSGGEKQRVAIGRAILSNPRLLLMDEPLSALDDTLRFQIIPYLKSVSEQFAIPYLFISHSLLEMRLMAEQVLVVSGGKVSGQIPSEQLARACMGESPYGYINLLKLSCPVRVGELYSYPWGHENLLISDGSDEHEALFELSSKEIILFKKHPEAISARNLLKCRVVGTFTSGKRVGIELASAGDRLIAEVVKAAAQELEIVAGSELYVAIKASAFRRMG
jgi:molybdate transport system ATP-binding protein